MTRSPREELKTLTRAVAIGAAPVSSRFVKTVFADLRPDAATLGLGIDGGARFLRKASGFGQRIWVGDWDSLGESPRTRAVDLLHLSPNKDRSDLAFGLAVLHALQARGEAEFSEVVLLGVTGGRPDHHLASLIEIVDAVSVFRSPVLFRILEPDWEWFCMGGGREISLSFSTRRGDVLSLFSLDGRTKFRAVRGLKYRGAGKLRSVVLGSGSHGLSNVATGRRVDLRLESGTLLGVLPGAVSGRSWKVTAGKSK